LLGVRAARCSATPSHPAGPTSYQEDDRQSARYDKPPRRISARPDCFRRVHAGRAGAGGAGEPGLAALESRELAEVIAELLARYDPAYRPAPDLRGPFDPARDHLLVISEGGGAYLYRLDSTPNQTRPLLTVVPHG
jgi:hypothetical protein